MKNTLVFVLLILMANSAFTQDLIITNEGDSINCKITKVKTDYIYFTFKYKSEIRNTLLPVSDVKVNRYDFYHISEVPKEKIPGYANYPRFRVAINGGFSYETAKIGDGVPVVFKDYLKDLKTGYHFGGDLTYYFSESLGLGVKSYLFKSTNSLDNIYIEDIDGNRRYGKLSDDLSVSFIGPTFSTRLLNHYKTNAFLMGISLGYMGLSDNKVIVDKYKMTGSTLGLALDIGYDFGLSENLSLGLQVSLLTGTLSEYKWSDGTTTETIDLENGDYENLNRIDFSVGLRFGK